ncbi:hypothetical protein [Caldinitratiruptor microaerophilus]|uniref:Uncharacterized protein n=1 Tax=Caldinitratiruptor microaerophilus TaxID=671077 RepID=A0AA35CKC6_9FIRM|nr:hypothetical protein [Caldinitratiruptor microaerophilus]BDG60013.1 hypothetical protein caldi_11030 [Caldinitratiruptor microaerophilus]
MQAALAIRQDAAGPGVAPLPPALAGEIDEMRSRFGEALMLARKGDYSRGDDLRALARAIGRLLAREARRPPAERGLPMRELSIAVARRFPELSDWALDSALRARLTRSGTPRA